MPTNPVRGGSWNNTAENCTAGYRNQNDPANRNNNLGFRVLLSSAGIAVAILAEPALTRSSRSWGQTFDATRPGAGSKRERSGPRSPP